MLAVGLFLVEAGGKLEVLFTLGEVVMFRFFLFELPMLVLLADDS